MEYERKKNGDAEPELVQSKYKSGTCHLDFFMGCAEKKKEQLCMQLDIPTTSHSHFFFLVIHSTP